MILLAVRSILERNGYQVIGEAQSGIEALAMCREFEPDLVVLDIRIPKLHGLEVIRRIVAAGCKAKVLVLSSMPPEILAKRCEIAGASAFVCKKSGLQDLIQGIHVSMGGYTDFPSDRGRSEEPITKEQERDQSKLRSLTDQEIMVVQYLASGSVPAEIAQEMMVSIKTVSTYKCRAFAKLGISKLSELQDFASRNFTI